MTSKPWLSMNSASERNPLSKLGSLVDLRVEGVGEEGAEVRPTPEPERGGDRQEPCQPKHRAPASSEAHIANEHAHERNRPKQHSLWPDQHQSTQDQRAQRKSARPLVLAIEKRGPHAHGGHEHHGLETGADPCDEHGAQREEERCNDPARPPPGHATREPTSPRTARAPRSQARVPSLWARWPEPIRLAAAKSATHRKLVNPSTVWPSLEDEPEPGRPVPRKAERNERIINRETPEDPHVSHQTPASDRQPDPAWAAPILKEDDREKCRARNAEQECDGQPTHAPPEAPPVRLQDQQTGTSSLREHPSRSRPDPAVELRRAKGAGHDQAVRGRPNSVFLHLSTGEI